MKSSSSFSRRGPDLVAEELAAVLSNKTSFEFKDLFSVVHTNLKARNAARGGEEMLRLRAYEKLQRLVELGIVKRNGKEYRGVPAAVAGYIKEAAAQNQEFEARKQGRPPVNAPIKDVPVKKAAVKKAPVKAARKTPAKAGK